MRKQGDRSLLAPVIVGDAQLEHWANVYLANPQLRERGVLFESFLARATRCPVAVIVTSHLLKQQRLVQQRLDLEHAIADIAEKASAALAAESHCADGAWTEKMRHRAYPRVRRGMQRQGA